MSFLRLVRLLQVVSLVIAILSGSCGPIDSRSDRKPLFTLLPAQQTYIDFINRVEYTEESNTYTYRNFYNGAGIGLGDINNDGLPDIYFCSNQTGNRLYLNKGNFEFEDITETAKVACTGSWSTGVSFADLNGDGWLDIYVCKSGIPGSPHRANELFINNGDLTFTEKAKEYGLDQLGLSNHASFFDYDRDGDLDCYLLNNSFQSVTEFDMKPGQRQIPDSLGANKLFRNDEGHFVDVTEEAGIYGSKIGFGLGVSAGDINRDGWIDIYISNDFFERDYLYINNRDGTFTESLEKQMREISLGAMGGDMADINNDTWPEIFATEMTPEGNARLKTKAVFDDWKTYLLKIKNGYYRQFARNVLQLNNRNGTFSEIGRFSGVCSTDWSWGALIMDLDNDGWKDIFVANGIFKDLLDRDYLNLYSNPTIMRSIIKTEEKAILKIISMIPSVKVPNYAFHNNHDLTFTNLSESWGLSTPSFSNGAAYGDLDNDGDLDLVVNNVNMPPFICRNESDRNEDANFLVLSFKGEGKNTRAVGAAAILYFDGLTTYAELIPSRGFQSCVDSRLHFGLGHSVLVDSIIVNWPDGKCSVVRNISANQFLKLDEEAASFSSMHLYSKPAEPVFQLAEIQTIPEYRHQENEFNDFERDGLLFGMLSNEGPQLAAGDVNKDGYEDFYICGAKYQPGTLFLQDQDGHFKESCREVFAGDSISEETACDFFDADGDGDIDLYVASGGNEFPSSSSALKDRLYINDGKGHFTKSSKISAADRFESTSCVKHADFDNDGDIDLFVGIRLQPFSYGVPVSGYLLENDGKGLFRDVTEEHAPGLKRVGMITDMTWADIDNDGDQDILIAGDWMQIKAFINDRGTFTDKSDMYGLQNTEGWWNSITAKDLNGDGFIDFVLGNHGTNSYFKASKEKPLTMYVNDFDLNGSVEQIICAFKGDKSYPVALKDDLVKQIPSLALKYQKYEDYKDQTIDDIFPAEVLQRSVKLKACLMESIILLNTGSGSFRLIPLPAEAQFSPVYASAAEDFDHDGFCDILLGGNQYRAKPQTGIYDASYGLLLTGDSNAVFRSVAAELSGFSTKGEIRDLDILNINEIRVIAVSRNNDNLQFFKY